MAGDEINQSQTPEQLRQYSQANWFVYQKTGNPDAREAAIRLLATSIIKAS